MAFLKTKKVLKAKTQKILLRDKFRSCITKKEIQKYRNQIQSVEADLQTPKLLDQPLHETIMQGIELAKQHNRKIASEAIQDL